MTATNDRAKRRIENVKRGARMRSKREQHGLKASWVATQIGIAPAHLYFLETGQRPWTDQLEEKFLKAIGEI